MWCTRAFLLDHCIIFHVSLSVATVLHVHVLFTNKLMSSQEQEISRLRASIEKMAKRNLEFSADVKNAQEQRDKVRVCK